MKTTSCAGDFPLLSAASEHTTPHSLKAPDMTTFDQTRSAIVSPFASIMGVVASVMAWNDQRVTRKSLSALTDRELNDIGLARGDIETM